MTEGSQSESTVSSRLLLDDIQINLSGHPVVNGVSMSANGGDLIGLIGPNGAGKTTLARAIAGILPFSGSITLDGANVSEQMTQERARQIAYLPQTNVPSWPLRVWDVVALGRAPHQRWRGRMTESDTRVVHDAIRTCDIANLAHRSIDELSVGEQVRVMVARALAVEAAVLVVDEPTASLDPHYQLHIMDVLKTYAGKGRIVIAIMHDLALAARYCSRLTLLNKGRVIADDIPTDVLSPKNLRDVYQVEAITREEDGEFIIIPRSHIV